MEKITSYFSEYLHWLFLPKITISDVFEILILAFVIYHAILWVKDTRAWMLVKGIAVLLLFWLITILFDLDVILWIFKNSINVVITAVIIVFQPELRKALEQLGRKNYVTGLLSFSDQTDNKRFSDSVISEIVRASYELARTRTGALIVIEQDISLSEFERTGIQLDAIVTRQMLINIFEHNTPLHDGAVIIRGDRIVSATCYLPLSDNMELSKELGTRHRAGIGISEVTDSLTIIVSEETGKVSVAYEGVLSRSVDGDYLRNRLMQAQYKTTGEIKHHFTWWKKQVKQKGE